MASKKLKLTDRSILAAKPAGEAVITYDTMEPGMGLRTMPSGYKSFVFLGRFPGKRPTRHSLGAYAGPLGPEPELPEDDLLALSVLTLAQAREKARLWRRMIQRGLDPEKEAARRLAERQEKERRKAADTFEAVARRFLAEHVSGVRTARAIGQLIENKLIKEWGPRPIITISKRDVVERIADVRRVSGTEAARQTLIYTKLLFAWAMEADIVAASPCPTVRRSKLLGPKKKPRQRTLDDAEIELFWRATAGDLTDTYPAGPFMRLLLILGCRRGELALARHREFDLTKPGAETWTLKGERTKNGEPRAIPLPARAVQMIAELPRFDGRDRDFLFTTTHGRRPFAAYSKMKRAIDRKIAELNGGAGLDRWTLHDLRRTMRTRLSALPISPVVRELMIGHGQQGIKKVYDVFAYQSEQREGFEAWCARLRDIVEPPPDNVLRMRAVRP
jgi:integrase